jgi:uncharacterized protein (DUF433 family)/DNA-binding transcriptional MerR regulator
MTSDASPVALGQGIYTVPETCRILRPSMTPRKVHYWLDTELLGEPLRKGSRGVSTLLSFEQVLKVRTLQRLREDLGFSLQEVRRSLERLLDFLTGPDTDWHELSFTRSGAGHVAAALPDGDVLALRTGQIVMDEVLTDLREFMSRVREQWSSRRLDIEGFELLVSDAAVLGGAPTIKGTRIETAFVANLSQELTANDIHALFPHVGEKALHQAAEFEGVGLRVAA